MAKRMISVRVDETILAVFDAVAWERKLSRTALIEQVMQGEVDWYRENRTGAPKVAPKAKPAVIQELKAGLERERTDSLKGFEPAGWAADGKVGCLHPKDKRVKFAWGSKCGVCNSIVR